MSYSFTDPEGMEGWVGLVHNPCNYMDYYPCNYMDYGGWRPLNDRLGLCLWLFGCEASPCLRAWPTAYTGCTSALACVVQAPMKSQYVTWGAIQVLYAFAFACVNSTKTPLLLNIKLQTSLFWQFFSCLLAYPDSRIWIFESYWRLATVITQLMAGS